MFLIGERSAGNVGRKSICIPCKVRWLMWAVWGLIGTVCIILLIKSIEHSLKVGKYNWPQNTIHLSLGRQSTLNTKQRRIGISRNSFQKLWCSIVAYYCFPQFLTVYTCPPVDVTLVRVDWRNRNFIHLRILFCALLIIHIFSGRHHWRYWCLFCGVKVAF